MHKYLFFIYLLFSIIFFQGCSGYRFKKVTNPLQQFGIKSVVVPHFINRSSFGHAAPVFTREFHNLLKGFSDLEVVGGESASVDAVLVGIIRSKRDLHQAIQTKNRKFVRAEVIGERRRFLVPSQNELQMDLQLILIKNPSHLDLKLMKSNLGVYIQKHPKVIFNETLDLSSALSMVYYGQEALDEKRAVNFTNTQGSYRQTIQLMAEKAVVDFKELILYAF